MSNLRFTLLLVLVVVVQAALIVSSMTVRSGNPARTSYRRHERDAAFNKLLTNPSEVNQVAVKEELRLAARHDEQMAWLWAGFVFAFLLAIDAWVVYIRILSRRKEVVA